MDEYFAIIKSARRTLISVARPEVKAETERAYLAQVDALISKTEGIADAQALLIEAGKTTKISTWRHRRSALIHAAASRVSDLLLKQDKIQRALKAANVPFISVEWDAWREIVRDIEMFDEALIAFQNAIGPPLEAREKCHSKREDLKGLARDWRERLVRRMPRYSQAVIAAAITGCRASELMTGVQFQIVDGELLAYIEGSKKTEHSGQKWRRLYWKIDRAHILIQMMVNQVSLNGGNLRVQISSTKNFSGAIRSAARREWPSRNSDITAHCFRHAASADMKASSLSSTEISMALGHTVDKTKRRYGHFNAGSSGGIAPDRVEAERSIKEKKPSAAAQVKSDEIRRRKCKATNLYQI